MSAEERAVFDSIRRQLERDWNAFKKNPYFLYEEMDK